MTHEIVTNQEAKLLRGVASRRPRRLSESVPTASNTNSLVKEDRLRFHFKLEGVRFLFPRTKVHNFLDMELETKV